MNKRIILAVSIFAITLIVGSGILLFKVRNEGEVSKNPKAQVGYNTNSAEKDIIKTESEKTPLEKVEEEMDDYFIPGFETAVKMLQENVKDFNLADYRITSTEGSYTSQINPETGSQTTNHLQSYIDLSYKIGDFVTDSGYVIILDGETGNFLRISDDTKKITIDYDINDFLMTKEDHEYYLEKAKSEISKPQDIQKEEVIYFYYIEENKKYALVTITMNGNNVGGPIEKMFEITN